MEIEEMRARIQQASYEMDLLKCRLESRESDVGDWKIIKIYEYRLQDKEDPYDFESLQAARQAVRDQINDLQNEIAELTEAITTKE